MYRIIFNEGKHQRRCYYWLSNKDIEEGDFIKVFESCRDQKIPMDIKKFNEFTIVSTSRPIAELNPFLIIFTDKKSDLTYTEVAKQLLIFERGKEE